MSRFFVAIEKNLIPILQTIAALLFVGFALLSYYCYWADSEIWGISLARQLGNLESHNHSVYFKLPFYAILRALYLLPGDNTSIFTGARLLFCVIGAANAFLVWRLARALFADVIVAWLAVVLLLGSTLYLNQGFRVRSDILSAFWHLVTMNWLVGFARTRGAREWKRSLGLLLFLTFCMLTTTPKAVYFLFAEIAFVFAWARTIPESERKHFRRITLTAFFLPIAVAVVFLAVSTYFSRAGGSSRVFVGYWTAWVYFRDALAAWNIFDLDSPRLFFLTRFLERNLELAALVLGAIVTGFLPSFGGRPEPARFALALYGFVLLVAGSTYNDYLPFFLASLLPILCLAGAAYGLAMIDAVASLLRSSPEAPARGRAFLVLVLGLYTFGKGAWFFQLNLRQNSNLEQRAVIHAMEKQMASFPGASLYDVIGTLPRLNQIYKFVGPGQDYANRNVMEFLNLTKPDFLVYVRKASLLEPGLSELLGADYVNLGHRIYGRALTFNLKAAPRTKVGDAEYAVFPAEELMERFHALFPKAAPNAPVYFYLKQEDGISDMDSERILYQAAWDQGPEPIGAGGIAGTKLRGGGKLYIPAGAGSAGLTVYPPIELPYTLPVLFVFSFDHMF